MVGRRFIAIVAAMVAGIGALAVAGLFVDWRTLMTPPAGEQAPGASDTGPAESHQPAEPKTAAANPEQAAKPAQPQAAQATASPKPPTEPTPVPTFDVVVIEPNGEGVIAGRAAPGWQVSVQSGGVKVGEAKADVQGEWSVVLEKPLPVGDHALSLKTTSPDGTQALTSQESVRVAVGADVKTSNAAPTGSLNLVTPPQQATESTASQHALQAGSPTDVALAQPDELRAVTRAERAAQAAAPAAVEKAEPKPMLVFKTVDYQDTGPDTGIVNLSGTSNPGATLQIYYGDQPVVKAHADRDGAWRVTIAKKLGNGEHSFRAERIDLAGAPSGQAKVAIERLPPKPAEVAAKEKKPEQLAEAEQGAAGTQQTKESAELYIIRRGDTLWAIAKRYFGSGLRYTSIFEKNRGVIQNPNLIHPKQEVAVPPAP
jgi:LysM repeat protein